MSRFFVDAFLAAAVMASPSPTPQPVPKTIVTVYSSQFCTALTKSIRPAMAGLLQNDQLIERGHSTLVAAGYRFTHNAIDAPSAGGIGPPALVASSADNTIVEQQQRRLAKNLEDNIEAVENILTNRQRVAVSAKGEAATLSTIETQLNAVLAQQRTAVNLISGQAEGSELATLFNQSASPSGADAANGVSPLEAMKAGHGFERDAIYNVWQAASVASTPFYDPYALFSRALAADQTSITEAESVAAKSIMDAAAGCR